MKFLVQMFGTIRKPVFCTRVPPKVRGIFFIFATEKALIINCYVTFINIISLQFNAFMPALDEFLKSTFEELFWSDQNPIARWEFIASSHFFCKSRVQEKSHKNFSAKANITEVCLFENQVIVLLY